ncbi:MAG TPA: AMP-binding protein [Acidimicrobiales bacterium]|nr:AMP-binding protein [Acidimicrobiales bacterium]
MDLELLLSMAVSFDDARVAVTGPDGTSLTTGELEAAAAGAATLVREAGATRLAFCDTNGLAFPVALFGAVKARLPLVPLNYRLSDEQLGRIVGDQDLLAVASPELGERLRRLGVERVLESSAFLASARAAAPGDEPTPVDPDEVALLLYTSGTTAAPKAAVLRHRNLAAYVIGTVEFGSAGPEEAALLSVPPYHIAGVMNLLSNLYMGRRVVYLDAFRAEEWLERVREQAVTHAMVVPTMLARIVAALRQGPADAPSLRTLAYGGAKMPAPVIEEALRRFPHVAFTNAYGLTETSSTITVLGPEAHRQALSSDDPEVRARLGSAGLPVPGVEIEIRDEDGERCGPGAGGEIFVRGEQVAGEYLGAAGGGDGWFATRDRGHLDSEGYLFIEGRSDDTIIRGGENIAPAEIEDVLLAHEAVEDCAVVGVEDEEWGQRIAAVVVLVPGATVGAEELRAHARAHLRGSKTPDEVRVVDELPYTDTGKLLRRVVREQLVGTGPSAP